MTTPDELRAQAEALNAQAARLEVQLTQQDVSSLYRERRYAEIEEARLQGRLNDLLTGTTNPTHEEH